MTRSIDLFGEGAEFDHVGMAASRIDDVLPGAPRVTDPVQKVTVAFFQVHGLTFEAIEPACADSPISAQMDRGMKLLHVGYRVPDLDAAVRRGKDCGLFVIAAPAPAVAFHGRRIAWLYSLEMGLFELIETPEAPDGPESA